jgi:hypothetical protein
MHWHAPRRSHGPRFLRRRTPPVTAFAAAALVASSLFTNAAHATPRPLPFTYTTETLGKGEFEVEQFADLTPVVGLNFSNDNPTKYVGAQFQTEFEYGITDRLELGLYVVYVPTPAGLALATQMTEPTGTKQRLRYVLADPGAWPIDVGLYGELVEGQTEFEFEGKILLQRRFGNLRIDANLWAEYELNYGTSSKDVVLNPTGGLTYEVNPAVHVGVESWMRAEYPNPAVSPRPPNALGPAVYVGPAILLNFGKVWWSTGLYARATDTGLAMQPGDTYGPVWGRTIVGFEL